MSTEASSGQGAGKGEKAADKAAEATPAE